MAKGWTKERRRAQAERCRRNRPWEHATGPRTAAGKARSSMNAYKHGGRANLNELARKLCAHNREFVKATLALHKIELNKDEEKQALIRQILKRDKNELKDHCKSPDTDDITAPL